MFGLQQRMAHGTFLRTVTRCVWNEIAYLLTYPDHVYSYSGQPTTLLLLSYLKQEKKNGLKRVSTEAKKSHEADTPNIRQFWPYIPKTRLMCEMTHETMRMTSVLKPCKTSTDITWKDVRICCKPCTFWNGVKKSGLSENSTISSGVRIKKRMKI